MNEPPPARQFVRLLRGIRERRGWTQRQLARELSVSPRTISRWERGKTEPLPIVERVLLELVARDEPGRDAGTAA